MSGFYDFNVVSRFSIFFLRAASIPFQFRFPFCVFFPSFFSLIPIFCDVFFVETRIFFDVLHVFSGIVLVL